MKHLFIYWFQGRNLLVDGQNFKRGGDIKKRKVQISRGESLFPFLSIKTYVTFVSVIPVSPSIKLMTALLF